VAPPCGSVAADAGSACVQVRLTASAWPPAFEVSYRRRFALQGDASLPPREGETALSPQRPQRLSSAGEEGRGAGVPLDRGWLFVWVLGGLFCCPWATSTASFAASWRSGCRSRWRSGRVPSLRPASHRTRLRVRRHLHGVPDDATVAGQPEGDDRSDHPRDRTRRSKHRRRRRLLALGAWCSPANDLAPLPSLHEGMTILACVALWPRSGRATRVVLVTYPLVMAFSLVYTGEHYVSDLVAGALMVVAVIAVEERVRRRGIRLPLGGHALPGPAQSGPRAVTCARRPRRRPLPPGLSSPRAAVRCLRSSVRTTPRTTSRTSRSRSSQVQGSW
jgi:hypothetical protein